MWGIRPFIFMVSGGKAFIGEDEKSVMPSPWVSRSSHREFKSIPPTGGLVAGEELRFLRENPLINRAWLLSHRYVGAGAN